MQGQHFEGDVCKLEINGGRCGERERGRERTTETSTAGPPSTVTTATTIITINII